MGKVDGMKACHCFRTVGQADELHMVELSCYCGPCYDSVDSMGPNYVDVCEPIATKDRPYPTLKSVKTEAQRARDAHDGLQAAFNHAKGVLEECKAKDVVLVSFDPTTRDEWSVSGQ